MKKEILTMEQVAAEISQLFPGEVVQNSVIPFSDTEYKIGEKTFSRRFCVLFLLKGLREKVIYDVFSRAVIVNAAEIKSKIMELGVKTEDSKMIYKIVNAGGQYGIEMRRQPLIKTAADAVPYWNEVREDFEPLFKGCICKPFVRSFFEGDEGFMIAVKASGNGRRDILFIRAQDGRIFRKEDAVHEVHFYYLEPPRKNISETYFPKRKKKKQEV